EPAAAPPISVMTICVPTRLAPLIAPFAAVVTPIALGPAIVAAIGAIAVIVVLVVVRVGHRRIGVERCAQAEHTQGQNQLFHGTLPSILARETFATLQL